jgi:hypothetical protein
VLVPQPFRLASSLHPIPFKLVQRIQSLKFVEMRELLPDNMALAEKLEALPSRPDQPAKQLVQREVGSLLTWISFATYVAIMSQAHPERVVDMLAYMRLLIREAHKFGGEGWRMYDSMFRRNQQGCNDRWDLLDPSLHMAYIGPPLAIPCRHCNKADHDLEECALAPTAQPTRAFSSFSQGPRASRSGFNSQITKGGKRTLKCTTPQGPGTTGTQAKRFCISWNRGQCVFPGACSFRHVCPLCESADHQAKDCPRAPPDSFYRQPQCSRQ